MTRGKFIALASGSIVIAGVTYYLRSDKNNFVRKDSKQNDAIKIPLQADEREILFLASLALLNPLKAYCLDKLYCPASKRYCP